MSKSSMDGGNPESITVAGNSEERYGQKEEQIKLVGVNDKKRGTVEHRANPLNKDASNPVIPSLISNPVSTLK